MDETSFSSQSGPPLEGDGAFPNIYAILFDEVKDEEIDFIHEVTHEDTEMELVCEVNENEVTGEVNEFLGFTDEEIELSRDKANKFQFFCNDWMVDFNKDTLWSGRNYKNLQFSLNTQNSYAQDTNVIYEFQLFPKYVEPLPNSFTVLESATQQFHDQLFDIKGYTYNLKNHVYKDGRQHWRCSMNQTNKCKANIVICKQQVVEFNDLHEHEPKDNADSLLLVKDLKFEALKDPYAPAPQLVTRILAQKGIF